MKFAFTILFLAIHSAATFAQNNLSARNAKPPLDTGTFDKWLSLRPTLVDAKVSISSDGNFLFYKKRESWRLPATLVVQATNKDWKMEFQDVETAAFTNDSRKFIFIQPGESLCLLTLGNSHKEHIPHVSSFRLFNQGKEEWLAYIQNASAKSLVLRNLTTGKEKIFPSISEYQLSKNGNVLITKTEQKKDNVTVEYVTWVNLPLNNSKLIWEGNNASNFVIDEAGSQLAFRGENKSNDQPGSSFWYYKDGSDKAVQLVSDQSEGIDNGMQLDGISKFSKDGTRLFIRLREKNVTGPKTDAVKVDVWSSTDAKLQSLQLSSLRWLQNYLAVVPIGDRKIIRLQLENELVHGIENDDFLLMTYRRGDEMEAQWNPAAKSISYLVATGTGERKPLKVNLNRYQTFSPNGKYLAGLDENWKDIYCYDITSGITRNITADLNVPLKPIIERDNMDSPQFTESRGFGILGWTDNGDILINDEFDIWQIDPSFKKLPINLTSGYGQKNKIEFRLTGMYSGLYSGKIVPGVGELIVTAFNKANKNAGFYKISMGKNSIPQQLSMGPYFYEQGLNGACQIKARNANMYVVMRESTTESPNYFQTKDFKNFTAVSSVYPEKNYNWFTSELISFNTLDNRDEQAVIYKPENFESTKKYPVIIHYYEKKSQDLNKYHKPAENNGELDIAWFSSHGYVVVTPDIHYKIGEPGQSALNSVVAVGKFLSLYNWVDTNRIGLQGHSFGGYETNYIVANSTMFAAACSSSGVSDQISNYGSLWGGGSSRMAACEEGQHRIGATLWERPDLYIKNSPLFNADKVVTPILTIANKNDGNVPFAQGVEWFLALRRLGKVAWMLQYDEGSHGLEGDEYKDYIIRMTQFFDHYLKETPAPTWMTNGIPAKMKGL